MKKIKIQDLTQGLVKGIEIQLPNSAETYKESYFEWTATSVVGKMNSNEISGGVLRAWHHTPVFYEMENHIDTEMFYFVSGVALMMFIDVINGKPDNDTAQIIRIQPGTQISISAGKGHFVAVAEGSDPLFAIVVSPKMDAPRMKLSQTIEGE